MDVTNPPTGEVFWSRPVCLMCPGVHVSDGSEGRGFRAVHEGFDPAGAIDEFGGGDDVFHPAVLHLRQEAQSSYFCISHPSEEEHQRGPILPLLTCWDR